MFAWPMDMYLWLIQGWILSIGEGAYEEVIPTSSQIMWEINILDNTHMFCTHNIKNLSELW